MPTIRATISEDLEAKLSLQADQLNRPVELVAGMKLQQHDRWTRDLPTETRLLILSGEDLDVLERILGGGSLTNGPDLRQRVERLAGVSFFHVRLPFTPSQLELLADKAARQGLTVHQLVERTAPRVYEQFFDLLARA